MGFENVTLADTKLEKPAPVPAGHYVFQLQPGASYRQNPYNQIQELNVRFDVASEGEFQGRPVFVTYPDPTAVSKGKDGQPGKSLKWSAQALKKLEISLGVDALPGEDTAAYLNRVALSGSGRVTADILPGKEFTDSKTGQKRNGDPDFGIFTVAPAA
jgi:hypothetical protein